MRPTAQLIYAGRDITADAAPYLEALEYTDLAGGKADALDVSLADPDGRWSAAWYPRKGDTLEASFGYEGEPLTRAGLFHIDEVTFAGAPAIVTLRALSVPPKGKLRTVRYLTYEAQSLSDLVGQVARRAGLSVSGDIEPVSIERETQLNETDLAFLHRILRKFGHYFSVRGNAATVYKYSALWDGDPVATVRRTDVESWTFTDSLAGTYARARVSYDAPSTATFQREATDSADGIAPDVLEVVERVEANSQAATVASAALRRANTAAVRAGLVLLGNPRLLAGTRITLADFGALDGKYFVEESRHDIRPSGYRTHLQIFRL